MISRPLLVSVIFLMFIACIGLLAMGSVKKASLESIVQHTMAEVTVSRTQPISKIQPSTISKDSRMNVPKNTPNTFKNLTSNELHNKYEKMVLIDVRTRVEYNWKHIPGAQKLNRNQILQEIPKDKPIAVICLSGHRSIPMANWLIRQGYQDIYNLKGGFLQWWRLGYPSISGSQPTKNHP